MQITTTIIVALTAASTTLASRSPPDYAATIASYKYANCTDGPTNPDPNYQDNPADLTKMHYDDCTKFKPATNNVWIKRINYQDNVTFYTDDKCDHVGNAGTMALLPSEHGEEMREKAENISCVHQTDFKEVWKSFKITNSTH